MAKHYVINLSTWGSIGRLTVVYNRLVNIVSNISMEAYILLQALRSQPKVNSKPSTSALRLQSRASTSRVSNSTSTPTANNQLVYVKNRLHGTCYSLKLNIYNSRWIKMKYLTYGTYGRRRYVTHSKVLPNPLFIDKSILYHQKDQEKTGRYWRWRYRLTRWKWKQIGNYPISIESSYG
jgi:hypothetical protein